MSQVGLLYHDMVCLYVGQGTAACSIMDLRCMNWKISIPGNDITTDFIEIKTNISVQENIFEVNSLSHFNQGTFLISVKSIHES